MLVLPVLLAVLSLLLLVCYLQYRWHHRHILSAASKLPCPPALPIIGNAHFFLGDITSVTKNIIRFTTQFKGLFCIWVGPVPVFVVSDPSDAQTILNSSNTLEKDDIYSFLKPYLGNGLLTAPVPMWKKYRRLLMPVLHNSNVEKFLPTFNEISKDMVETLAAQKQVIDPRDSLFSAATDAIMRTVIARSPIDNSTKKNIQFLLNSVGRMFTYRLFKPWLHVDWIFNLLYRREVKQSLDAMTACTEVFDEHWKDEERIRNATPESSEGFEVERTFAKNMVDVCFAYPSDGSEDHEWLDEITTMIVGATDTVVAALSFLFVTLANHPEAQAKVHAEIQDVMGDSNRDVHISDLNCMTYLGQAIMETMRLHGIFPVILRRATKDTKLSNGTLPAGSRVMLTLHAMGWNPDEFPEPEQFRPERFLPEAERDSEKKRHPYAFLPFSGGVRSCLGKAYAMMLMKTVAVHVLRRYRLTTQVRLQDIDYELKVVMFSKTPVMINFEPL